jgi:DNA replication protein DnaC
MSKGLTQPRSRKKTDALADAKQSSAVLDRARRAAHIAGGACTVAAAQGTRDAAALQRHLVDADLPCRSAVVDTFVGAQGRGLEKHELLSVAGCTWLKHGINLVVTGPAGSGKSFVASALARAAVEQGKSVRCWRIGRLLTALQGADAKEVRAQVEAKFQTLDLAILDGWGVPDFIQPAEGRLLAELVSLRMDGGKSVVFASSIPVAQWPEWLGCPNQGASLVARMRSAYPIALKGIYEPHDVAEIREGRGRALLARLERGETEQPAGRWVPVEG